MSIRTLTGPDAVKAAVGEELGVGDWIVVDQNRISQFAAATGDRQWIHVDVERAASGPFGTIVAHGFLTLALLPVLAQSTYLFDGFAMRINYGLDRVRFPNPVRAESRLRLRATLQSAEDTLRGLRVTVHALIETEGNEEIACVADSITLLIV